MRDGGVGGCPPPLARPQFLSTAINHHHKSSINHQSVINHQLIINPATHSPSHPLTHSLTHAPTHSLTHSIIHSHTHSLTHSLTHPRADHTTSTLTHVGFFGTVSALMFIRFSCSNRERPMSCAICGAPFLHGQEVHVISHLTLAHVGCAWHFHMPEWRSPPPPPPPPPPHPPRVAAGGG